MYLGGDNSGDSMGAEGFAGQTACLQAAVPGGHQGLWDLCSSGLDGMAPRENPDLCGCA